MPITEFTKQVQPTEQTSGSAISWQPRFETRSWAPGAIADECRRLTPSNEELLKFAQNHRPPQSWFDETDDPRQPAQ